jgi:hypothetical protein
MKRVCSRNLLNCAGCDGLFPPPMDMYPAKNRAGVCGSGSVLLRRVECAGTLAVSSARIRSSGSIRLYVSPYASRNRSSLRVGWRTGSCIGLESWDDAAKSPRSSICSGPVIPVVKYRTILLKAAPPFPKVMSQRPCLVICLPFRSSSVPVRFPVMGLNGLKSRRRSLHATAAD